MLTDCHMPEMDGFDLAAKIKSSPHLADAVVMMLTSGEQSGDIKRCRELGISMYLTKPVRRADLRSAIMRSLAARPAAPEPAVPAWEAGIPADRGARDRPHDKTAPHILVVEDNIVNQRVALRILEKHGYRVVLASNGVEALKALKDGDFELVLMGCANAGNGRV